eukprot:gb/GECG01013672.1/.p1 GENE.gb/GECG01013672.1/~~gb/GECG01013672.1/.p1  ORF type:complete len:1230 (+),score=102.90 gb/GECG01013672.1/:1-3690(+)
MGEHSGSHRLQWTIAVVRFIGIGLFIHGFFLTRTEFSRQSHCDRLPLISMPSAKNSASGELQKSSISSTTNPGILIPTGEEDDDVVLKVPHSLISEWHKHAPMKRGSCWSRPVYSKVLILIIDALRYDFLKWQEVPEMPFHNQFEFIHNLTMEEPQNSAILRFIADAPTATMQRIKGLTTGTLPTFMDISDSFGSDEIREDNIIHQFARHSAENRSSIFVGDDTWASLFPGSFNVTIPYPSFNVKDLYTVDNGVYKNIISLLANGTLAWKDASKDFSNLNPCNADAYSADCMKFMTKNWQLCVGHFLGVDHVGHTFSPMHSAMQEKLREMDLTLKQVVQLLNSKDELKDTLLIAFGDHGMTLSGNHGGASDEEKNAGLFVYSPTGIYSSDAYNISENIFQVDLVPSLSTWMGLPFPHANIGGLIGGLSYDHQSSSIESELVSSSLNSAQVAQYLLEYSNDDSSMSTTQVRHLFQKLQSAIDLHELVILSARDGRHKGKDGERVRDAYRAFRLECLEQFQWMWTKFNLNEMSYGIFTVLATIIVMALSSGYNQRNYLLGIGSFKPLMTVSTFCGGLFVSMALDTKRFWVQCLTLFQVSVRYIGFVFPEGQVLADIHRKIQERMNDVSLYVDENCGLQYPLSGLHISWNIVRNNISSLPETSVRNPLWSDSLSGIGMPIWELLRSLFKLLCDVLVRIFSVLLPSWVEWIGESLTTMSILGDDVSAQEEWGVTSLAPPPLACGCISLMLFLLITVQWHSNKEQPVNSGKTKFLRWSLPVWLKLALFVLLELRFHGLFSNSFIVAEAQLINHVLISLLCLILYFLWDFRQESLPCVSVIAASVRMTVAYVDWKTDTSMQPHRASAPAQFCVSEILWAATPGYVLICCLLLVFRILRSLRFRSLWKQMTLIVSIAHSVTVCYWLYQRFGSSSSVMSGDLLHTVVNYACRMIYLLLAGSVALILRDCWWSDSYAISSEHSEALKKIKSRGKEWNLQLDDVLRLPGAIGLLIMLPLYVALELMHGAGNALNVFLILIASGATFYLSILLYMRGKSILSENSKSAPGFIVESNYNVLALLTASIFHLLTMSAFFATHGYTQFSSLNFAAPFTGWDEYSFLRGALMMTLSTFGTMLFPLFALSAFFMTAHATSNKKLTWFAEAAACHTSNLQAVCTFCSMVFCFMARRHLMVWSIFAPKLIFDMAFMLVVDLFFVLVRYVLPSSSNPPTPVEKSIKVS